MTTPANQGSISWAPESQKLQNDCTFSKRFVPIWAGTSMSWSTLSINWLGLNYGFSIKIRDKENYEPDKNQEYKNTFSVEKTCLESLKNVRKQLKALSL